jgi:hypothetical protein
VLAVMNVEIKHVPLIETAVHERLSAPVVVSDLFPDVACLTADGEEPVVPARSQTYVFNRVPKILSLSRIGKKTPIVVLAK